MSRLAFKFPTRNCNNSSLQAWDLGMDNNEKSAVAVQEWRKKKGDHYQQKSN